MNLKYGLLIVLIFIIDLNYVASSRIHRHISNEHKSRTVQRFFSNCMLNKYMHQEFKLGMQYLNASIYMLNDRVALHGFGKMFKSLWNNQLSNVEKIRKYIIFRGGKVETPYFRMESVLNQVNHFKNESTIIQKFLHEEKMLNRELLEVYQSHFDHEYEKECQTKLRNNVEYFLPTSNFTDPYTADFLDEHFTQQKLENIKNMADLITRIERLDETYGNIHVYNQVGIILLDQELHKKY